MLNIVKIITHNITEDFGTYFDDDMYDRYLGQSDDETIRYVIMTDKRLESWCETEIPDDPFNYSEAIVICQIPEYEFEMFKEDMLKQLGEVNV